MEYVLTFGGLIISSYFYIKLAKKYNIVDIPNERSSHSNKTIRGGGIIFPISILIWFLFSEFPLPLFFAGLAIISVISFMDDLSPISTRSRFIFHLGALLLLFSQLQVFELPWWSWIPILIISAGIINAYNFMDGINGITGGYSIAVLTGLWIVNNYQVRFIDNDLIYFLVLPLVIFNYLNFRQRAICFAGDVGSISIAYVMVFLLAKLIFHSGNLLYILFLALYGVDTVFTLINRIIGRENIFKAHRKHLYQLLANELKISQIKIAVIYSLLQLCICLIIILISDRYVSIESGIIAGFTILSLMALAFHFIKFHIKEKIINI